MRWVALVLLVGCDGGGGSGGEPPRGVQVPDAGTPLPEGDGGEVGCGTCRDGARQCLDEDRYMVCEVGPNGCTRWGTPLLCPHDDLRCRDDGRCCPVEACDPAAPPVCTPEGLRRCAPDADGCLVVGAPEPCPGGAACTDDGLCPDGPAPGCCMPGEQRCAGGDAYEVCGEGTPACWQFSAPLPCAEGQTCEDGRCAGCVGGCRLAGPVCADDDTRRLCVNDDRGCSVLREEDCPGGCVDGRCVEGCDTCAAGDERCVGTTLAICQRVDGCLRWVDGGTCEDGCQDRCGPEGARTCSPDGSATRCARGADGCLAEVDLGGCPPGARECNNNAEYRVCEADAQGCFRWAVYPCEGGNGCFALPGACEGGCADACALGAVRCRDADSYETCQLREGCPTWVVRPCAGGTDCIEQQDACTGTCDEVCRLGDRRCVNGQRFRECVRGPSGCPEWREAACADGADCFSEPVACYGQCAAVCEIGARECGDGGMYRECDEDFDGCPGWEDRFCRGFEACADAPALCFGDCQDACSEGTTQCDGGDAFRICVREPGGCTRWERRPCLEGDCFSTRAACVGECDHACETGARRCLAGQQYESCDADFQGCRRWTRQWCDNGATCNERPEACYGACDDACTLDRNECVTADTFRVCVAGAGGCTVWQQRPCENGASCFNGRDGCFGVCRNECEEDARECLPGGRYRECMRGFDGCTEWVERFCFNAADCAATPGACFGDCSNQCDVDDVRCATGDTWQGCALRPDGQCTVWTPAQPCATEESCWFDTEACAGR